MGSYIASTPSQQGEMLSAIGLSSMEQLFSQAPDSIKLKDGPAIPNGLSELEVSRKMRAMAAKNTVFGSIFRGAGAYHHYIPSIVKSVTSKETFITTYTPYQAELAQGVLQSIFEYQTMICELTGMDVSNASVYDGASAAAEAATMCRDRKRQKTLVSGAAHPDTIATIQTYCWAANAEVVVVPAKDGVTDLEALASMLDDSVASVYIQQPSFCGILEDCEKASAIIKEAGAKFIMGINPIAAAVVKNPGECGADIAVGEGQPLGMPLSFGGPYLGFMATTTALARRLPGRIVGQTTDVEGKRAFVLTLQAREQHIRREKASSNVCSNQALCALTASVYLSAMGPEGLRQVAVQSMSKAHYLAEELDKAGLKRVHTGPFFHEFVTNCPGKVQTLMTFLESKGILGGLPVEDGILWCATEMNSKEQIDELVALVKEGCKS